MSPGPFAAAERPVPGAALFEVLSATRASASEIADLQRRRLLRLLQAAQAAPLYHRLLYGRELSSLPLQALPVMGKALLMAQPHRVGCWAWESSGSTGQPGLFVHDETAMAVYDALEATRRHAPRPWARFFDPLGLSERCAFVGAIGGHFASVVSVQRLRAQQPWLGRNWRCFSILQPTPALVAELDDFAPTVLATYPTAAVMLAGEAQRGRLQCRPREVWTGGETLSPAMRIARCRRAGCRTPRC